MNISLQNIDKVSGLLTIKLEKADYQERVDKELKKLRAKINMPGFRPGMVPMGIVKKQYGKSVLAEEINKMLQEKIYEYVRENKINMIGEPLPNEEKQQPINFGAQDEFEFVFDIAIAPEVKVELSEADKLPYYDITVSDAMVDGQVQAYRQRTGKYEQVETYEDNDMVKGHLAELDENDNVKEGGLAVENAILLPRTFKNEEQKSIFRGAKVNDVIVFNPSQAYGESKAELAALLKIKEDEVEAHKGNFSYQLIEITRFVEGELTQEVFDQIFGKDVVKSEEEFRQKTRETIEAQLGGDSDYKFLVDSRDYIAKKVGELQFPDALLKKIMLANNSDKGEAFVNEHYADSIKELTWHLIREQLVKDFDIKTDSNDIVEQAKKMARAQFAQYGMVNVPEDALTSYAQEMLKKEENVRSFADRAVEAKIAAALKNKVTLEHKEISMEDFTKLFED